MYNFQLRQSLKRNEWTQVAFVHSDTQPQWLLFIDGSLQIDIYQLRLHTSCESLTKLGGKQHDCTLHVNTL